jgi:curved DNA-binding protein CbpA
MGLFSNILNTLFGNRELENKIDTFELKLNDLAKELVKKDEVIAQKENEKNELQKRVTTLEKNKLAIYEDKEQKILQKEIANLENELEILSEEKNEYINEINRFNTRYTLELGEIIEELLELKAEYLYLQINQNKDSNEDIYREYEEIKEEYQNFHSQYEDTIQVENNKEIINNDDLKKLKKIFRDAVKLCHPDIVSEDKKDEAHKIMQKLNDAYQRKMFDEVMDIFDNIQNDFTSDAILDIKSLDKKTLNIKKAIEDTTFEINNIINSDDYMVLNEIEDFEKYFEDTKKEFEDEIEYIQKQLTELKAGEIDEFDTLVEMEKGAYSQKLRAMSHPNFDSIRSISIGSIYNSNELFNALNRGTKILEEEAELYQYIHSFGKMHKAKLYSSFDTVIHQLNNQTINIIDWGCGQVLATILLIDYIKEKKLNINISNTTLIEPSQLALSRGLLHIDILKENPIEVKALNKDIDCLEHSDLIIDNSNITLHLFSNILDVEFFKLDKTFLEKIKHSQDGLNYFICVSPNINDKRNSRLDMFYRYFSDNFNTELISDRDSHIGNYARYEKIFKVLNL